MSTLPQWIKILHDLVATYKTYHLNFIYQELVYLSDQLSQDPVLKKLLYLCPLLPHRYREVEIFFDDIKNQAFDLCRDDRENLFYQHLLSTIELLRKALWKDPVASYERYLVDKPYSTLFQNKESVSLRIKPDLLLSTKDEIHIQAASAQAILIDYLSREKKEEFFFCWLSDHLKQEDFFREKYIQLLVDGRTHDRPEELWLKVLGLGYTYCFLSSKEHVSIEDLEWQYAESLVMPHEQIYNSAIYWTELHVALKSIMTSSKIKSTEPLMKKYHEHVLPLLLYISDYFRSDFYERDFLGKSLYDYKSFLEKDLNVRSQVALSWEQKIYKKKIHHAEISPFRSIETDIIYFPHFYFTWAVPHQEIPSVLEKNFLNQPNAYCVFNVDVIQASYFYTLLRSASAAEIVREDLSLNLFKKIPIIRFLRSWMSSHRLPHTPKSYAEILVALVSKEPMPTQFLKSLLLDMAHSERPKVVFEHERGCAEKNRTVWILNLETMSRFILDLRCRFSRENQNKPNALIELSAYTQMQALTQLGEGFFEEFSRLTKNWNLFLEPYQSAWLMPMLVHHQAYTIAYLETRNLLSKIHFSPWLNTIFLDYNRAAETGILPFYHDHLLDILKFIHRHHGCQSLLDQSSARGQRFIEYMIVHQHIPVFTFLVEQYQAQRILWNEEKRKYLGYLIKIARPENEHFWPLWVKNLAYPLDKKTKYTDSIIDILLQHENYYALKYLVRAYRTNTQDYLFLHIPDHIQDAVYLQHKERIEAFFPFHIYTQQFHQDEPILYQTIFAGRFESVKILINLGLKCEPFSPHGRCILSKIPFWKFEQNMWLLELLWKEAGKGYNPSYHAVYDYLQKTFGRSYAVSYTAFFHSRLHRVHERKVFPLADETHAAPSTLEGQAEKNTLSITPTQKPKRLMIFGRLFSGKEAPSPSPVALVRPRNHFSS